MLFEKLSPKFYVEGVPFYWGGEERKRITEEAVEFEFEPDDILVAGYPRSGTTFRRALVWLVAHDADVEKARKVKARERIIMLDRFNTEEGEMSPTERLAAMKEQPRVIFTHLPYTMLQKRADAAGCKVICLLRNPKDVAVSLFHVMPFFLPSLGPEFTEPQFSDVVKSLCADFDRGNILDHNMSYWKHKDDPRFLFLFYEDHHKNYGAIARQVAKFLRKELSEEQEQRIAEFFDFDKYKSFMNAEASSISVVNEKQQGNFVRKGEVAQWKNYFTVAQNEMFEEFMKKKLAGCQIPYKFE